MSHKPECNEKWGYDKDHCICDWIDKAEQRIIKLLEEAECQGEDDWCKTIQQAIALIKGANK